MNKNAYLNRKKKRKQVFFCCLFESLITLHTLIVIGRYFSCLLKRICNFTHTPHKSLNSISNATIRRGGGEDEEEEKKKRIDIIIKFNTILKYLY